MFNLLVNVEFDLTHFFKIYSILWSMNILLGVYTPNDVYTKFNQRSICDHNNSNAHF